MIEVFMLTRYHSKDYGSASPTAYCLFKTRYFTSSYTLQYFIHAVIYFRYVQPRQVILDIVVGKRVLSRLACDFMYIETPN